MRPTSLAAAAAISLAWVMPPAVASASLGGVLVLAPPEYAAACAAPPAELVALAHSAGDALDAVDDLEGGGLASLWGQPPSKDLRGLPAWASIACDAFAVCLVGTALREVPLCAGPNYVLYTLTPDQGPAFRVSAASLGGPFLLRVCAGNADHEECADTSGADVAGILPITAPNVYVWLELLNGKGAWYEITVA